MSEKKKRANFSVAEVEILLELWGDSAIQKKFGMAVRHNVIWEQLAQQMCEFGFQRTASEVKSKVNNLKTEYRKLRPTSGSATPDWPYYESIHKILGQRDTERDELVDDSFEVMREIPQIPAEVMIKEIENYTPVIKHPRLSTINCAGTSGTSGTSADESQEESQEECVEVASEADTPTASTAPRKEKTMKRIPRPSQRKAKDIDNILNYLKASEEKQSQQIDLQAQQVDLQNKLLESLLQQENQANEREERIADAFIETMAVMRRILPTLSPREPNSPASPVSPPIRNTSPIPLRISSSFVRASSMSPPLRNVTPLRLSSPLVRTSSISPPIRVVSPVTMQPMFIRSSSPTLRIAIPKTAYTSSPTTSSPSSSTLRVAIPQTSYSPTTSSPSSSTLRVAIPQTSSSPTTSSPSSSTLRVAIPQTSSSPTMYSPSSKNDENK